MTTSHKEVPQPEAPKSTEQPVRERQLSEDPHQSTYPESREYLRARPKVAKKLEIFDTVRIIKPSKLIGDASPANHHNPSSIKIKRRRVLSQFSNINAVKIEPSDGHRVTSTVYRQT